MQNTNEEHNKIQVNNDTSLKLKADSKSNDVANEIVNSDVSNLLARREIVKRIDNYGQETLELAMQRSKNLSATISTIGQTSSGDDLDDNISKLEKELRTLDPSGIDFSKIAQGFSKLFSPVTKYFNKIQQEEDDIEDIIATLIAKRNVLSNDNITLELEIDKITDTIKMLNLEYEVGEKIKAKIQSTIDEAKQSGEDASKIAFYEEEVIVPLEKKLYDIKEVIIVNEQSALEMEVICKNNKELIRNVDRIKNVTLVAVNTAVAVAKSLYNQKLILKKIDALNNSTERLISKTGENLRSEATDISKDITNQNVSIDGLKKAFESAFSEIAQITVENEKNINSTKEEMLQIEIKDNNGGTL